MFLDFAAAVKRSFYRTGHTTALFPLSQEYACQLERPAASFEHTSSVECTLLVRLLVG